MLRPLTKKYSLPLRLYFIAFIVCMANWAILGIHLATDTPGYIEPTMGMVDAGIYGERLSSGVYYPSAYRTPGTSVIMLPFYFIFRDTGTTYFLTTLLFSALSPLLPLFAFQLGKAFSAIAAYVGFALMLLHANLHFNAVSVMSDLPFAACFSLGNIVLLQAIKSSSVNLKSSLLLGFCFGAAVLLRPTGLYWASGSLVLLFILLKEPIKARLRAIVIAATLIIVMVAPWLIRNAITLGSPTMETIKGQALLWSFGPYVTPDVNDMPDVRQVKQVISKDPENFNLYRYHGGYDYAIKHQIYVSNVLQQIALSIYKQNPRAVVLIWTENVKRIFLSQTHYDTWLYQLHASPQYQFSIPLIKKVIPRIETKIYHTNLELHRVSRLSIKYMAFPGFLLFMFMLPKIGMLQLWNIAVIVGLTAVVSGYDRFRLPVDPILCACSGLSVASLVLFPKFCYASIRTRHKLLKEKPLDSDEKIQMNRDS